MVPPIKISPHPIRMYHIIETIKINFYFLFNIDIVSTNSYINIVYLQCIIVTLYYNAME